MGDELLCISIPCPINIVALGGAVNITLELGCITVGGDGGLTPGQALALLQLLQAILSGIGGLNAAQGQSQTA